MDLGVAIHYDRDLNYSKPTLAVLEGGAGLGRRTPGAAWPAGAGVLGLLVWAWWPEPFT